MRSFYQCIFVIGLTLFSLAYSQAFGQQATNDGQDTSGLTQTFKIAFRLRMSGYLHISEDHTAGFYYGSLCTGAQDRGIEILRLFIDQVGNVRISRTPENFLAFGYTSTAAECAELRRSLEKINGDAAVVEFRGFVNAQRPLLWLSLQDGAHQIVVNGRSFNIYRQATLNPF